MDIVCNTRINELIHDRVLCLQVIIIIQRMTRNSPYKESNNTSIFQSMVQISSCKYHLCNNRQPN